MNENNTFHYTYSAAQNKEVQSIRQKYLPKEENKLELLKRLDSTVNAAGTMESLIIGILGCLLFGAGLCLSMQIIGNSMILGIFLGLAGAIGMGAAYPVWKAVRNKKREELAPRILALAEELMNG